VASCLGVLHELAGDAQARRRGAGVGGDLARGGDDGSAGDELGERLAAVAGGIAEDELKRIVRSRNVIAALLEAAIAAGDLVPGRRWGEGRESARRR